MWDKIKESKFGKACSRFAKNKGAVATVVCLILALTVVLTVSIAANRAKKNENKGDSIIDSTSEQTTQKEEITAPTYNDDGNSDEVNGDGGEEFLLSLPVDGTLAKGHDATIQVWSDTMGDYRVHLGVDIASTENAPVYAAADGEVARIWDDALMGKCVAISHDGEIYTIYKNLSNTLADGIEKGTRVTVGQKIGNVGDTAISELADEPHIHLEMTVNGLNVNPIDYFDNNAKEKMGVKMDTNNSEGK